MAGLGSCEISGAHGISIETDCEIEDVEADDVALFVLPGGMPGSKNLRDSEAVIELAKKVHASGNYVAAICAAPIALGRAGLLKGRKATCFPGFENQLDCAEYTGLRIECDDRVITAKGAGVAFEFAAKLAEVLGKKETVKEVFDGMFARV
jgi:4-methyl-5(b-hydroxyethyl)-thiazole monophosphate biosynthesis